MMALWLAPLALAGELSLSGRVLAVHRDRLSDFYFIKMQGMTLELQSPPGEIYQCLRQGLNTQELLKFTFDAKTLRISECQPQNFVSTNDLGL